MSDTSRQKLREIVATYGSAIVDDPRRLKALLKDFCGAHKLEVSLLVLAAEQRIPALLNRSEVWDPQDSYIHSLCDRLQSVQAMTMRSAVWTVRSWMYALGLSNSGHDDSLAGNGVQLNGAGRKLSADLASSVAKNTNGKGELDISGAGMSGAGMSGAGMSTQHGSIDAQINWSFIDVDEAPLGAQPDVISPQASDSAHQDLAHQQQSTQDWVNQNGNGAMTSDGWSSLAACCLLMEIRI
jgi:hypothetical protein